MRDFRHAWAFLTRLPGGRHPENGDGLTAAAPWFPLVGLVIGALAAATYVGLSRLLTPLVAAALTFAVTALVTGAFHEDGLADSFDALAGGWNREQRLEILKDSRHGTFGVLSLVLITLLKVSALAELGGRTAALVLVAAHCAGRAGALALMVIAPSATRRGLGADYARALTALPAVAGVALGCASLIVAFGVNALIAGAVLAAGVAAIGWWAYRKIGGVSGDLLGAAEQVGEALILTTAVAL